MEGSLRKRRRIIEKDKRRRVSNAFLNWVPLGIVVLLLASLPAALCSPGSRLSFPRQHAQLVTEKDTIEKFSKDVETVLHVLKANEYGSDPTIPGKNDRLSNQ